MAALQYQPSSLLCPTTNTANKSLVFFSSSSSYFPSQRSRIIPSLTLTTKLFSLLHLPKRRNNNNNNNNTAFSFRCFSALNPALKSTLDKVVTSNKVVLFMKGNKDFPQCGFSNTVVQILKSLDVPFETLDILENELLRQALKEYSNWPTFPQLYIDGQFFGGCDITVEAYKSGELQESLERAMCS
ncbi:hypothetical protein AQUCO_02400054v1 [Aquilegia coerulea]|uniref:Glutaredoxin domain-containing protein n=1 Tax=Aquilegia coerulea TaxID=218851 RepID=A0A2G5DB28_AQUCA|nr:hypothetical protein AQUCO_02400054v1 [Aquilegia coerulea]